MRLKDGFRPPGSSEALSTAEKYGVACVGETCTRHFAYRKADVCLVDMSHSCLIRPTRISQSRRQTTQGLMKSSKEIARGLGLHLMTMEKDIAAKYVK